jgi:chromosomal replication initiator protein
MVPPQRIYIAEIQKATAEYFEIDPIAMKSSQRSVKVARPRQVAMYLSKRLTVRSLPEIGRQFGDRDHSTVIHAVRRIEALRIIDPDIDRAVRALMDHLTNG